MKIYAVGGAIRDELLGLPVQDYDYVVVGATPAQMTAQGYRPVGRDFPVFLHPKTHAEYALARTERKTARGYHGFRFYYAPQVTLEQDLARRDLTINAMARPVDDQGRPIGEVIDPFDGRADLKAGMLRHVSVAFAEDPVRILRLARFAARLTHFKVADETLALMRAMVAAAEVDALVPERVWQEISRGLMEKQPSRMFAILHQCGALARLMPELALEGVAGAGLSESIHVIDQAAHAQMDYGLTVRFAVLTQKISVGNLSTLCKRLNVPKACRDLALLVLLVAREFENFSNTFEFELEADALVQLFERCDALRKPERFVHAIQAWTMDKPMIPADRLVKALTAARTVNAGAIAARYPNAPTAIKQAVYRARVAAVKGD